MSPPAMPPRPRPAYPPPDGVPLCARPTVRALSGRNGRVLRRRLRRRPQGLRRRGRQLAAVAEGDGDLHAGRVALNQAQAGAFDEYGLLQTEKVDAAALKDAEAGFAAYLKAYPAGQYAASARGLQRRVAWLGGPAAQAGGRLRLVVRPCRGRPSATSPSAIWCSRPTTSC
ncbi:MAG: hypothetical protein WDM85_13475 [Caulobacteraceae bacterium]